MPRSYFLVAAAATALVCSSCGSTELRRFRSEPPGAWVYVNGVKYGQTPCDVRVDFSKFPRTRIVIFSENRKPWEGMYDKETFLALSKETEAVLEVEPR